MSMKNRFEEKTQNYQGCLLNHDFQRIFTINYLCIEYIICRSIFITRIMIPRWCLIFWWISNADMSNTNNFPLSRISLNVMTLKVTSTHVNSVQGVPISVTGIAQVRNKFSSRKWDSFLLFRLLSFIQISLYCFPPLFGNELLFCHE